jgi:hypothetical protein
MAGCAARPGLPDGFGRCILVAATEPERTRYEAAYLRAGAETLVPQPKEANLDTHVVNLVAAWAARTPGEIVRFLERTLTGVVQGQELRRRRETVRRRVGGAISRCVERGLLTASKRTSKLWDTPLGRACVVKGLATGTACELEAWLSSLRGRSFSEAEALYVLCRTAEARERHVGLSAHEYRSCAYPEELAALLPPTARDFLGNVLEDRALQTYEEVEPMKMALLLHAWVHGWPVVQIEERYRILAGALRAAASTCAWLADAAAAVAGLLHLPGSQVRFLAELSERLPLGVPEEGLPLSRLGIEGIGRVCVARLAQAGPATPEALGAGMAGGPRQAFPAARASREAPDAAGDLCPPQAVAPAFVCEATVAGDDLDDGPTFRRQGEKWVVRYEGRTIYVADLVGMHYLARLLSRPGVTVPAERLRAEVAGVRLPPAGHAGEILDARAREEYAAGLRALKQEEATCRDPARQEAIRHERMAIMKQLERATGPRGQPRRAADDRGRARQAVTMAIRRALARIKGEHVALWRHLKQSIRCGRLLCYAPAEPVAWVT